MSCDATRVRQREIHTHTGRDETKERQRFTWRALKKEKWTAKTELLIKNGQILTCSFFPRAVPNRYVSYVQRLSELIKSGNVKRHYETKHKSFDETYPLKSALRAQKINDLKAQYDRSSRILTHSFTAQQRANECSLKVAWILGKHKKPFTDGGVVKECMSAVAETLFEGKQKEDVCKNQANTYVSIISQKENRNINP